MESPLIEINLLESAFINGRRQAANKLKSKVSICILSRGVRTGAAGLIRAARRTQQFIKGGGFL